MSNIEPQCRLSDSRDCPAAADAPVSEIIAAREAVLGKDMVIRRALPSRHRRMIGAWCFLDHAGPADVSANPVDVGSHPHIGLQTFTWPVSGQLLHKDSLGSNQVIDPGQVNLMTAGRGITHSEESPDGGPACFEGAQLWIALPDAHRHIEPAFENYPKQPQFDRDGFRITVLAGEAFGEQAPARIFSPLVSVDFTTDGDAATDLPLRTDFEYGLLVLQGALTVAGQALVPGQLLYLGRGRESLAVRADGAVRVLLIGGEPFGEEILLWWNYVARTKAEIAEADAAWKRHDARFGEVPGYAGAPLEAPALPWR